MWQSTRGGVPAAESAPTSASRTAAYVSGSRSQNVAVSSVSASAPASSNAARRYGARTPPARAPAVTLRGTPGGRVDRRLGLVGEPQHGRQRAVLGEGPQRPGPVGEG